MTPTCTAPTAEDALLAELRTAEPASFGAMFLARAREQPAATAYLRPGPDGTWQAQTWAQTATAVTEIAAGLLALGLRPEDRVAIASGTRVEWIEADFGVMCAGGATTTVYPSSSPDEVAHILTDSGSRFAVAENAGFLAKLLFDGTPVERVVLIDGDATGDARVLTLAELRELGRDSAPATVEAAVARVRPDDLATLIYTSGTTGLPKGVRIAHRAWVYQGLAIRAMGIVHPDDLGYLWLPLSHAFGKALLSCQLSVGFPFAVDGDVSRIVQRLGEVRPTIMPAVPRIFEKVYAAVSGASGVQQKLLTWAVRVAADRKSGWRFRIADRLVLTKIRARFGGRMRYFISGAAALSPDIARWFDAIGLPIAEGYGLTESCATTIFNRPDDPEYGTVGRPLPGTRVRIAEDGEILLSGPGMMQGYHGLDSSATLRDGWLHTGDIGEITERGSLRITDRKKDLIKTSNGKYVAPQAIEARFKAICPLAGAFVVHGEKRKFITALIDLDPDEARKWAAAHGLGDATHADIARSAALQEAMAGYVEQLNAGLNSWETIKKFAVLERNLGVETGELTSSLKLRRRVIEERYRPLLDDLYA
ncbi:long-chain acyl-CoA synthetase [Actinoplanes octamycinicus]|uniref:Acyl-CoA synthetase n=1 Tax=Actinoplanes octamycinicus TaxID=135948 RepID=A0A7W7MC49_9ACTN|nr:long-chain fatty acid--CoA ligase [Actinoplanes octamycinicus]MBB4744450.1 long-chain acyl-CoA synthetase [Actinoplanes octamycinicus]GIE61633.1 AMP-dependent synthetase [Actinoplanes octamycinicus]